MKIVFLTTLAGAVTYLPGDLVEYLDPFEAYRLIKAGTARAPTKDELSLNTWLRSTFTQGCTSHKMPARDPAYGS